METNRLIGGILLVAGTSIGAGMLALPVITSFAGFFPSLLALFCTWLFMYITALLLLEVNLASPGDANMISMANRTLGAPGRLICWVAYLLLLYSLTAAYIAGSAPLLLSALQSISGLSFPFWVGSLPLLLLFALFVYFGTRTVDYVNRLLMVGLIVTYIALVAILPSHIQSPLLAHVDLSFLPLAIPVMFTSFGFHIIIPTLSPYLRYDRKALRLTLLIGSFLPFLVYALWEVLLLGIVPLHGDNSLSTAWLAGQSSAVPLSATLQNPWITTYANAFSFFAIITSFLGVSLSLSDFLGDGLKLHRFTWGREWACLLTFLPPLAFVATCPRGFLLALQFAALFVAILLGILPSLMAWTLPRYRPLRYRLLLITLLLLSLYVIYLDCAGPTCFN